MTARPATAVAGLAAAAAVGVMALRRRLAAVPLEAPDSLDPRPPEASSADLPAGAAAPAQPAAAAREPAVLSALAEWAPGAPRTALGRAAAYLWASPVTLAGLLVAAASGARPETRDGVLLFRGVRGIPGWVLRARGFAAGTLGHVVLAVDDPSPGLWSHETAHVRQSERLGPLMSVVYLGLLAVYGYRRHPLERAARLAARRAA